MDSRTLIYNRVLIHLGISAKISHYNDKTIEATTISDVYDIARDFVLKDFDWNFAMKYQELSLADTSDNGIETGFFYKYHYPSDCVAARSVYSKGSTDEKEFQVAVDDNDRMVILANVCPAKLRYTKRIDKEVLFTPEFNMAFSLYLASLVAEALTGSAQRADRMLQKYEIFRRRSEKLNANEGRADDEDSSTYIDKRFY